MYDIETLKPADFDEWVEHCGSIFKIGPEYFRRHFVSDPYRDYDSIFIIKADEKIISTVRVFHRQMYIGGKIFKLGGVGEVCTNPDYRNLGLSTKLMEAATDYMKINDFDISMLSTGYFSHYAKHGFKQVKRYNCVIDAVEVNIPENILTLTPDYFSEMAALYDSLCPEYNCCIIRSPEYWQQWCAVEIKNPHGLFINDKLVGYVCFDDGWVSEIIADPEHYNTLISAAKPKDGKLTIPRFVCETTEFEEARYGGTMICLYKPITINEINFNDTDQLAEYINENGGVTWWGLDGF
jgi:GNAT superfamily N-acetyltransferase